MTSWHYACVYYLIWHVCNFLAAKPYYDVKVIQWLFCADSGYSYNIYTMTTIANLSSVNSRQCLLEELRMRGSYFYHANFMLLILSSFFSFACFKCGCANSQNHVMCWNLGILCPYSSKVKQWNLQFESVIHDLIVFWELSCCSM